MLDFNLALPLSLLSSGVGSLLAGFFGVRWALFRLKRERGFEQRSLWYRDMLSSVHHMAHLFDEARSDASIQAINKDPRTWERVERFSLLIAEARAYAPRSTIEALGRMRVAFQEVARGPDARNQQERRDVTVKALDAMKAASESLSDDLRRHFGLETVEASSWPYSHST